MRGMIELSPPDFRKAWPLYLGRPFDSVFAAALMEGNHVGRLFADQAEVPNTALALLACGFLIPAGGEDDAALNDAMRELILSELTPEHGYLFFYPPSDAWRNIIEGLFAKFSPARATRSVFAFDGDRHNQLQGGWRTRVPEGYTIRSYDRRLSEGVGLEDFWGSLDRFGANGVGCALLKGDEIVSRCHAILVGDGKAEISIETAESYRRQGFATLTTCAFIEECLEKGLEPTWSCWDANKASCNLATKLGFAHAGDVPVVYVKVK